MRLTRLMQGLMLVSAAACSSSVTAPPTGLPTILTPEDLMAVPPPSVTGAGDSVVAANIAVTPSCPPTANADAGLRGNTLVVTLIDVKTGPCEAIFTPLAYSVTVKDVPAGTRVVQVVRRDIANGIAKDVILSSTSITLP